MVLNAKHFFNSFNTTHKPLNLQINKNKFVKLNAKNFINSKICNLKRLFVGTHVSVNKQFCKK